jgi:hypothetical protein
MDDTETSKVNARQVTNKEQYRQGVGKTRAIVGENDVLAHLLILHPSF